MCYSVVNVGNSRRNYILNFWGTAILIMLNLSMVILLWSRVVTLVHEVGHLVFGLFTGYEFNYIHVGGRILVKKDGKLVFKESRRKIPAGSCLMITKRDEENFKFILYYLGGGIFTSILTVACFIVAIFTSEIDFQLFFYIASGYTFLITLLNLIPLASNDAVRIKAALQSKEARHALYIQHILIKKLEKGERYRDFDEQLFVVSEDVDYSNFFIVSMIIGNAERLYDLGCADKYLEQYKRLNPTSIPKSYRIEILIEYLYYHMIHEVDEYKVKLIYSNNDVKNTLKNSEWKYARVLAAYEFIINKNYEQGQKYFDIAKSNAEDMNLKGEKSMELDRISELEKKLVEKLVETLKQEKEVSLNC